MKTDPTRAARLLVFSLLAGVLSLSTGCAPIAAVSERNPRFRPGFVDATVKEVAGRIENARRLERQKPVDAAGELLVTIRDSSAKIVKNPKDAVALETYNFAVGRLLALIQKNQWAPWERPVKLSTVSGDFVLAWKRDPRPEWNPALYRFVPADQFDVRGQFVAERAIKPGIGAPTVAIGREMNADFRERFGLPRTYYGVTTLVRFENNRAEIAFEDPLATEDVRFGKTKLPLAADFTVPIAVLLDSANPRAMGIPRLLRPGRHSDTARIFRLEPYDPNKTIILVVHGLMDSPVTWTPIVNALRSNPGIRKNYQFWFFSYPSGLPYPYSAAILQDELDAVHARYPIKKPMVVIGHSMGGCIARLLVTNTGDRLWCEVFNKAPAETKMPPAHREVFEKSLVFNARSDIGRVIFIAAPLRGSEIAQGFLGRIGSMLVRSPGHLRDAGRYAFDLINFQPDELRLRRIPNSIDTLAPNSRFVRAVNQIPMASGIPLHVVAGDRGRGGNRDQTLPQMSDGVVPFWSSYVPEAVSEKIVPSNHSAHQHPETIAEVIRILKSNAKP